MVFYDYEYLLREFILAASILETLRLRKLSASPLLKGHGIDRGAGWIGVQGEETEDQRGLDSGLV